MNTGLPTHLREIRRALMAMSAVVDERSGIALDCLDQADFAAAEQIRHGDRDVDERELEIERMCIEALALHAPVASDLRTLLATLRINSELERLADLAKSIGKRILHLDRLGYLTTPEVMRRMARTVRAMIASTFDALARNDADLAREVRANDAQVDEFQRIILDWTHNELQKDDSQANEAAVDLLTIAKNLERMGDMCTNIAEDIIYMVDGEIVRHTRV